MKRLVRFVMKRLKCSHSEALDFISKFRHYDAVDYGRNIIENHEDSFVEGFDTDTIGEETLAAIAIMLEDACMSDLSSIEDQILEDVFGEKYI